jgi:hypothetical protein
LKHPDCWWGDVSKIVFKQSCHLLQVLIMLSVKGQKIFHYFLSSRHAILHSFQNRRPIWT